MRDNVQQTLDISMFTWLQNDIQYSKHWCVLCVSSVEQTVLKLVHFLQESVFTPWVKISVSLILVPNTPDHYWMRLNRLTLLRESNLMLPLQCKCYRDFCVAFYVLRSLCPRLPNGFNYWTMGKLKNMVINKYVSELTSLSSLHWA